MGQVSVGLPSSVLRRPSPLSQVHIIPTGRTPDIPVLMYHDIQPRKQVWFDDTVAGFRRQMQSIRRRGYHVITTRQLWEHLAHGTTVPARPVVLTFDDAGEGQFLYALPVLQEYHYPATFFIHTGYIGVTTSKAHMTWEQLKQAEATGLISVEARTVNHPCNMPDLTVPQLNRELQGGIEAVRLHLGHDSPFFSYPCGHYNRKAEDAVRAAGYLLAFNEERGFANHSPDLFAINRFTPRRFDEAIRPPPATEHR